MMDRDRPINLRPFEVRGVILGHVTLLVRPLKPQLPLAPLPPAGSCPHGLPGDRLWAREDFVPTAEGDRVRWWRAGFRASFKHDNRHFVPYDLDLDPPDEPPARVRWHPATLLPRPLARLALRVTTVDVRRLHDLTDAEAVAAGISPLSKDRQTYKYAPADERGEFPRWPWHDRRISSTRVEPECPRTVRAALERWCRERDGLAPWEANPAVWLIGVERADP